MHTLYDTGHVGSDVQTTEIEIHVHEHARVVMGDSTPPARPWIAFVNATWTGEGRREDGPLLVRLDLIEWRNPLGQPSGHWSKGPVHMLDGVHVDVQEYGLDMPPLDFESWDRVDASDDRFVAWSTM